MNSRASVLPTGSPSIAANDLHFDETHLSRPNFMASAGILDTDKGLGTANLGVGAIQLGINYH